MPLVKTPYGIVLSYPISIFNIQYSIFNIIQYSLQFNSFYPYCPGPAVDGGGGPPGGGGPAPAPPVGGGNPPGPVGGGGVKN
eukprot:CAMPEP_0195313774 /NCGR_PEP_ID=MMETSP0708-20121125/1995_1 /TAXON_ID=33640 /ORGANISM="Asterionellopsis glacialis, Strain CCMP134" /LENGTH=81 /DNA_ID=CAMNT_0040378631 /DNA_START=200 /DNA_END=445 /DNA_ORIENTATION=+